jgi:hypothetical protein
MEQATLIKIARLRSMAARQGKAFDVVRFVADRQFAQATLQSVLDTDDENLMVLGLELMDALKMVSLDTRPNGTPPTTVRTGTPVQSPTAAPAGPSAGMAGTAADSPQPQKYVGRLR